MVSKALFCDTKSDVIGKFAMCASDTGSSQVQVALLTKKIEYLAHHISVHKKDLSAKKTLLELVYRRRKFLSILMELKDFDYNSFAQSLGIKTKKVVTE